jgi:hypothetical protein
MGVGSRDVKQGSAFPKWGCVIYPVDQAMKSRLLLGVCLVLLVSGHAHFRVASAKVHAEAPPASMDEARKQFKVGVERARQGQWAEALVAFQVSYALVPNPAALFNLAGAQHRAGKLLVSTANYRRFNASSAPEISANHRKAAETQMARIEASIPRLRVVIEGLRPDDRLLIDNKRIYMNELDHDLWVDPGAHTVSVHRPGGHE